MNGMAKNRWHRPHTKQDLLLGDDGVSIGELSAITLLHSSYANKTCHLCCSAV